MPLRVAIGTLPRLTDLAVIERLGDWVLVNIRTEGGEPVRMGWVYKTLLAAPLGN